MARPKKTDAAPPPPKHWSEVKHGCCSCKFYKDDFKDKNSPCYPCTNWNYWEAAEPNKVMAPHIVSHSISNDLSDESAKTVPALEQDISPLKPPTRRTRKTSVVSEERVPPAAEPADAPKKRPGRPQKASFAQEEPVRDPEATVDEPKKRVGRPKKKASESPEDLFSAGTDQLSFGL